MIFEMEYAKIKLNRDNVDEEVCKSFWNWLNYWESKKESWRCRGRSRCRIQGCNNKATKAVHVNKVDEDLWSYLIPVCDDCREKLETQTLTVWPSVLFPV